jgi:hypothetical protein
MITLLRPLSDFQETLSYIMLSFPAFISEFATHPKTWGLAYNEKRNEISRDNHVKSVNIIDDSSLGLPAYTMS